MIKKYPQRILRQDAQSIVLHLNIPVADLTDTAEEMAFFQQVCQQHIEAQGWVPYQPPELNVTQRNASHLTLACQFTPLPPVRLPAQLAVTVEAPPINTPQPEELMAQLEALQIRWGKLEKVQRPIQNGDMVCIDAVGLCQGELVPQSVQHGFWLSIQAKNGPLATGLLGAQVGEQRRIDYVLPANYPAEHWQGAAAIYVVRVREVQALRVPVISDLAKVCDLPQVHDEESLFAALHNIQRELHQAQWQTQLRQRILHTLLKASNLSVPAPWVEEQLTALWHESDGQKLAHIVPLLTLDPQEDQALNTGFDSWKKHPHLRAKVQRDLAYQLLLQAVIRQHKLTLSEAQLEKALQTLGEPLHLSAAQVWQQLEKDHSAQQFLAQLTLDHAERYLVKQARVRHGDTLLPTG